MDSLTELRNEVVKVALELVRSEGLSKESRDAILTALQVDAAVRG